MKYTFEDWQEERKKKDHRLLFYLCVYIFSIIGFLYFSMHSGLFAGIVIGLFILANAYLGWKK